ncbi:cysteine--tRNA ligase [Pelagibacterium xiamenense]|uniref:cysteine--tRNA ligase n=1 Tax=Pelagibacterium xiamenense TaxID=2901140 RepID=UPI001E373BBD|nr:cysteine--tRNA ligase [Pelagibacterium xiamenense]MCD7059610.1 cysteine--tRNA ligase [Pelagibacterium xiamenense]
MPSLEPALTLYNTLTRTKEAFAPIDPAHVRMYVCGPTVYDYAHIGNARPVIVFDVLFRLLRHIYGAEHVTYVRNITDVDDKINARAARDYPDLPLNDAIRKVTETTANQFHKDVAALGCLEPTVEPRATEHIGDMIAITEKLVAGGHAYEASGEVLFSVASMPEYGALSGRNLEDNIAGARVAVEDHKRNPADFVLWKQSSAEEPGWDSPWGRGRPGWHLECSAMSERHLGATFDIHGGGLDLIFPHHENEIAQSRCAHGTKVMANYWMHNGYLQVEGRKMSKSEGNFVTIHDLLETDAFGGRKWPGEVLRLAMLMTHYREPIDFSVSRLEEAERKLADWQRIASNAQLAGAGAPDASVVEVLSDDLNFSRAAVALDAIARKANRGEAGAADCLANSIAFLGLPLDSLLKVEADVAGDVETLVYERLAALAAREFDRADKIRADLLEQGVQLMDYKDPDTGEKRTKWEVRR